MSLKRFIDYLYPPLCAVCKVPLRQTEDFCADCEPRLDSENIIFLPRRDNASGSFQGVTDKHSFSNHCKFCGSKTAGENVCLICRALPLGVNSLYSIWKYNGPIVQAIKQFKYQRQISLANYFASALAEIVPLPHHFDLIIPLPSSASSERARGYSHTALIAKILSRKIGLSVKYFALNTRGARPSQASLSLELRLGNMKDAFYAKKNKLVEKRVLLLDDVVTTGASIYEAAQALKIAGAKSVDVITLARSPSFTRNRVLFWLTNGISSK